MGDYCSLPKLSGSTLLHSFPREGPAEAGGPWVPLAAMYHSSETCKSSHTAGTRGWRSCALQDCRTAETAYAPDAQKGEHVDPTRETLSSSSIPTDRVGRAS